MHQASNNFAKPVRNLDSFVQVRMLVLALACLLSLQIAGCATPQPREGSWLSFEQISPTLRRRIGMDPGDYVKACGRLINVGQFKTAKQLQPRDPGEPYEEVLLADGPSNFYDRKTGL